MSFRRGTSAGYAVVRSPHSQPECEIQQNPHLPWVLARLDIIYGLAVATNTSAFLPERPKKQAAQNTMVGTTELGRHWGSGGDIPTSPTRCAGRGLPPRGSQPPHPAQLLIATSAKRIVRFIPAAQAAIPTAIHDRNHCATGSGDTDSKRHLWGCSHPEAPFVIVNNMARLNGGCMCRFTTKSETRALPRQKADWAI